MGLQTVTLNDGHGYVMGVGILSAFVMMYGGVLVGKARKKLGVTYPTMYLPDEHKHAKEFNCTQRAHQNCLENYPPFLMLLAIGSLNRPYVAAGLGLIRVLGFLVYIQGYNTGNPDKRMRGAFGYIGLVGLLGLSCEVIYNLIMN